jgi:septal ring factor EnvC (AmiA/AmiB activator)
LSEFNDKSSGLAGSQPGAGEGNGLPGSPSGNGGAVELQVRRIQEKLQQLLKQRDILFKENGKLKEEVRQLQQEHTRHSARLEQLQQQVEILKATKEAMGEGDRGTLEKRLGQYIREIDRCIALLSE